MNEPQRLLLISRGRGHGHAVPDIEIADSLKEIAPLIDVILASYATGAQTIRESGRDVVDAGLEELPTFVDTIRAWHSVITQLRPAVVVAHEEFGAITAARMAGVPSIYLSAWFPSPGSIAAEALRDAHGTVIIENPGIFPIPPGLTGKVHYVGPIIRKMKLTVRDRVRARAENGWSEDSTIVLVVPGGWASEGKVPAVDLIVSAFMSLPMNNKRLVWLGDSDADILRQRLDGVTGTQVLPFQKRIDRFLAAADVVITKGTRGITYDAASVGVPSISISHQQNPIDDQIVPRIHNNIALVSTATTPDILSAYIEAAISRGPSEPLAITSRGCMPAADAIVSHISALADTRSH